MKTRIEYVERLTGKLKGHRGVVFEDTPTFVHMIDADDYNTEEIDGERYAPFPRFSQEYRTLSPARPAISVGDTLKYKGTGEVVTVKQITLGKKMREEWYIITDDTGLRSHVDMFEPVEPDEPSEPMTIYTVYYRHIQSNEVTGVEMNARNIQHAIEETFEWIKEMDDLEPEEIDICHVEVANA